jgi:hypothetical protein
MLITNHNQDEPVCHKFSAGIVSIDDIVTAKNGDLKVNPLDLDDTVYGLELLNNNQNHYASKYLFKIKAIRTDEDFGVFGCTISNEYGNADFLFEVKRRRELLFFSTESESKKIMSSRCIS